MKVFTKEEWSRMQYTGRWDDNAWSRDRVKAGEVPAYYIGRRHLMEPGPKLITEGVHFLIDGDYDNLPVLHKDNALEGAAYQFAGGVMFVNRVYRFTEQEARERGVSCLDRAETSIGDIAIPGGDMVA